MPAISPADIRTRVAAAVSYSRVFFVLLFNIFISLWVPLPIQVAGLIAFALLGFFSVANVCSLEVREFGWKLLGTALHLQILRKSFVFAVLIRIVTKVFWLPSPWIDFICCLACLCIASTETRRWLKRGHWEVAELCQINREPSHVLLRAFPDAEQAHAAAKRAEKFAMEGGNDEGPRIFDLWNVPEPFSSKRHPHGAVVLPATLRCGTVSLDGEWDFKYFPTISAAVSASVPGDLPEDDCEWNSIRVPGSWQCQGYGKPVYTNVKYPFPCDPPFIPALHNPVGLYRTTFVAPANFFAERIGVLRRRIHIVFRGADSALDVFINGRWIGHSQDSRLPAEFDVSMFLQPGENTVMARVFTFSAGSYLEDQDHFWLSGLHRSVELIIFPQSPHISDFHTTTVPASGAFDLTDELGTGDCEAYLRISATVRRDSCWSQKACECSVVARLFAPDDTSVLPPSWEVTSRALFQPGECYATVKLRIRVERAKLWNPEAPVLYTLVLGIHTTDGHESEADGAGTWESCHIGFRTNRVDKVRGQLLLNGIPIIVQGVNRHDHDPRHGKVVDAKLMRRELLLMKANHFNALRTSHYPNDENLLILCDVLGLMVFAEANLETHGDSPWPMVPFLPQSRLANDVLWRRSFIQRNERMVARDRNHSSVIVWSLGNESGYGENLRQAAATVRALDGSRPLHYEGERSPPKVSDLICPMYPSPARVVEKATAASDIRPVIMCEYSHAMGNSNGNLDEYWKAIRDPSIPRLQGGFIWDFKDQGLEATTSTGQRFFGYGGNFGGYTYWGEDAQFCINGLCGPDLVPHPAMLEAKTLMAPVSVGIIDPLTGDVIRAISGGTDTLVAESLLPSFWITSNANTERRIFVEIRNELLFTPLIVSVEVTFELFMRYTGGEAGTNVFPKSDLGPIVAVMSFPPTIPAQEKVRCAIAYPQHVPAGYYILTIRFRQRGQNIPGCLADALIVEFQFLVDFRADSGTLSTTHLHTAEDAAMRVLLSGCQLKVEQRESETRVLGSQICVVFGHDTKRLRGHNAAEVTSLCVDGIELLGKMGIAHCFTRAATDNDRGGFENFPSMVLPWLPSFVATRLSVFLERVTSCRSLFSFSFDWRAAGLSSLERRSVSVETRLLTRTSCHVRVRADMWSPTLNAVALKTHTEYVILGNGAIVVRVSVNVEPKLLAIVRSLARVGMVFGIRQHLCDSLVWAGRGPHESYPDRRSSASLGVHNARLQDDMPPYEVPSEHGGRADVYWIELCNAAIKRSLAIVADTLENHVLDVSSLPAKFAEMTITPFTIEELDSAKHTVELPKRQDDIMCYVDAQFMGIGGDNSWMPIVHRPYWLTQSAYNYSFWVIPRIGNEANYGRLPCSAAALFVQVDTILRSVNTADEQTY